MEPTPSNHPRLARLLRPFAKVEPSEVLSVLALTTTVFLFLTAYYLLKTAREPLILLSGGAEVKSYAAAGQAVLLLVFLRVYASLAQRFGRLKLLVAIYLFFASNLAVFAGLMWARVPIGVPFYLWVGVFNYTCIAQFWAFAADVYTPDQGKRLFAIIGIGSSVGAVVGARLARTLVPFGTQTLMLTAMGLLVVCVSLIAWVDLRSREEKRPGAARTGAPVVNDSAFWLLLRDDYLLLLAALTLVLNWVNSNGEYLLDRTLLETIAREHPSADASVFIGQFKADYFAWVNLGGVALQLFAVSRILSRLGVRAALRFLPIVVLVGYGILLFAPALALIRLSKIAENSTDYSVQNTSRQALYLVTSRPEKYVGKTVVDTFFVRFGDVLSAVLVWISTRLALPTFAFAIINLTLVGVWLVVLRRLAKHHVEREGRAASSGAQPARADSRPTLSPAVAASVLSAAGANE